jgi:hypothetical protein
MSISDADLCLAAVACDPTAAQLRCRRVRLTLEVHHFWGVDVHQLAPDDLVSHPHSGVHVLPQPGLVHGEDLVKLMLGVRARGPCQSISQGLDFAAGG